MYPKYLLLALAAPLALGAGRAMALEEGTVTWHDPTCGFFVLSLPEGPPERFGLFSWKSGADPKMDQVWQADNIIEGDDMEIQNKETGAKMIVLHWANAKEQAQLVRNTPVQCASRWKKRK